MKTLDEDKLLQYWKNLSPEEKDFIAEYICCTHSDILCGKMKEKGRGRCKNATTKGHYKVDS